MKIHVARALAVLLLLPFVGVGVGVGVGAGHAHAQALRLVPASGAFVPYGVGDFYRCSPTDIPDGPAHASRMADGTILMMASSAENYPYRGRSLLGLEKDCRPVLTGGASLTPAAFDSKSWLLAPFTIDGVHVLGLVHNEFHGERVAGLCHPGTTIACWYNSITAAISDDDGRTFHRPAGQSALVAVPRYTFAESIGTQRGYFGPTNIVRASSGYAFMAYAGRLKEQVPGNCLFETSTPFRLSSWKAWDGSSYAAALSRDPYQMNGAERSPPCAPIAPAILEWPVASLAFHATSGLFIALMVGEGSDRAPGIFYAESKDLRSWAGPWKLFATSLPSSFRCGSSSPLLYPSLLDPTAKGPDFAVIGDHPALFVTSDPVAGCHPQFLQGRLMLRQMAIVSVP